MQLPPPSVMLSWPMPNYENPAHVRGPALVILTAIFAPLTFAVVLVRVFTRLHLSKSFGSDDIFIVAASIPAIACGVITVLGAEKFGWNRHVWDVPLNELVLSLKLTLALEALFAIGSSLTKLSLLCFTRKITAGTNSVVLRWLVIVNMAIVALEMIIFCIVVVFNCRPISAYWTLSTKPQKCINETAHLLAGGIVNTLTDFCVVILPIPTVMALKLPNRQRLVLVLLFGAGFAVCIAGSVRVYYVYKMNTTYDKTWAAYPVWISGTIEMYLGVFAASLASLKPFFVRYLPTILGTFTSQRDAVSSVFASSRARQADSRSTGQSKNAILRSYQTTTTITSAGQDIEFESLNAKKGGVVVSQVITYETRNASVASIQSLEESPQSQ
ncbi:hypothetical protein MaudCBS49596_002545 [Microsporum audouinii]